MNDYIHYMEHKESIKQTNDLLLEQLYTKLPLTDEQEMTLLKQIIGLKQLSESYPEDIVLKQNIKVLQNYMN